MDSYSGMSSVNSVNNSVSRMGKKSMMPSGNYSSFIGGTRLGSSPDKRNKQFFDVKPQDSRQTMQNINDVLDDCEENFDIEDDEPTSMVSINKT